MASRCWALLFLIVGASAALIPTEESLRSALDAVARKQRSLDGSSQEYYNDLHSFKYHGDPERKFERERQGEREIDEEDAEIEFLPNETGQLETVGNGFQGLNNKLLERALMDYLETAPEQEEPVPSVFRERERSSSRKRGNNNERMNVDNKDMAKVFLEELQDGSPDGHDDMDDEEYLYALKMLYDRYISGRSKRVYDNEGPMSWGELLNKASLVRGQGRENDDSDFVDQDQEQSVLYLSPAERRNVNGRYPIGRDFRTYRNMVKRYPVAKRSPKPLPTKKQITDPKVAQDLGALFGTQSTDSMNLTHDHGHDHDHDHDHDHNQDQGHDHGHAHDHDHDHAHGEQHNHESSTESPKVSPPPKGQKENATKVGKSKSIEVRKKSVDWSQYFGIDRRKKKATFMAGQGTQNQDDEWMLQRYYENMAENLKPTDREFDKESTDRKDKLEQMDTKLKTIKDLIIEEALRYADSEDGADLQKVKDKVMTRMAAAYSLEKMRKALSDLRNNAAAHIEAQKAAHAQNNLTSNLRDNGSVSRTDDKRSGTVVEENEANDETRTCPELEAIEKHCKPAENLGGYGTPMLYMPCVMLQICKACVQDELEEECLGSYSVDAGKACDVQELCDGQKGRDACASTALIVSRLQPPAAVAMQCRMNGNESCLRRYYYRIRHRYLRYPYGGARYNVGYDVAGPQQSDR